MLEDDAQVMSDPQLEELLAEQPEAIQDEILRINDDARDRALQVALLVPGPGRPHRAGQLLPDEAPPGPHRRPRPRMDWG